MCANSVEIYIYDLHQDSNCWCKDEFLQILTPDDDILHSSVVVHGSEYSYGEGGVEQHKPKLRPQYVTDLDFEEAVSRIKLVGETPLTKMEVELLVKKMKNDANWLACKFNPVEHNCHHFADFFVKLLCGKGTALPAEIYNFNRKLLECREWWICEFYQND
ncbi:hypothetical protein TcasGA2_TC033356 [Tribolium castaneum]|uniref:PPPDE domain-containing protein n=1 Tax=Tribolium castaneum TaxID=7070 RepID=A0A139WGN5_TRICA|nr:hypothetical protein TcasGA2_TC033356 [Tribolium castaneum]